MSLGRSTAILHKSFGCSSFNLRHWQTIVSSAWVQAAGRMIHESVSCLRTRLRRGAAFINAMVASDPRIPFGAPISQATAASSASTVFAKLSISRLSRSTRLFRYEAVD